MVLRFPLERARRSAGAAIDTQFNAEIFVFVGVRYEKMQSQKIETKAKKTPKKKSNAKF